ncbi:MAG: Uma2 family endonuclease [Pirellulales bacterium]
MAAHVDDFTETAETTETFVLAARRWSVDEYSHMAAQGWFEGQHVELIIGEVLCMSPQGAIHGMCVTLVHAALQQAFGKGHTVRVQLPLRVSNNSEPEPNLAVVPGTARDYPQHPTTALLVVEVSETTLAHDRGRKASLYAAGGVPEYWMLDIARRRLEVFCEPQSDPAEPSGNGYRKTTVYLATETVSPLSMPQASISVASLLP